MIKSPAKKLADAFVSPGTLDCLINSKLEGKVVQSAIFTNPLQGFPTNGSSFIVLSNGIAANTPGVATDFSSNDTDGTTIAAGSPMSSPDGFTSFDAITLSLSFVVPENPGNLSFDWKFGTEENPTYLNSSFQDYFRADVITPSTTTNIALLPADGPATVDNADNFSNSPTNSSGNPGPPYPTPNDVDYNSVTSNLITSTFDLSPYAGEIITISFRIADCSDATLDSAVFLDNLQIEGCEWGGSCHHPLCEKLHTKQVLCDEIMYFEHDEIDVPIDYFDEIPEGSNISGTVEVIVEDCVISIEEINEQEFFVANFVFLTQKELQITTPDNDIIPLEFVERIQERGILRKCFPIDLELLNISLDKIRCEIIHLNASDLIILNTTPDNSFSEELTIEVKMKILADVQKYFKLCSKEKSVDIDVVESED